MSLIREIVQQTLTTGYLTVEAEDKLRMLLAEKYDMQDFQAFIKLQHEAMEGRVKQESRELLQIQHPCCKLNQKELATIS